MKRILLLLGAALAILTGVVLARTLRYGSAQQDVAPAPVVAILPGAAERLAAAVRIPTISPEDSAAFDAAAFQALHSFLQAQFPRVHSTLERETVGVHSLLYTWQGRSEERRVGK